MPPWRPPGMLHWRTFGAGPASLLLGICNRNEEFQVTQIRKLTRYVSGWLAGGLAGELSMVDIPLAAGSAGLPGLAGDPLDLCLGSKEKKRTLSSVSDRHNEVN